MVETFIYRILTNDNIYVGYVKFNENCEVIEVNIPPSPTAALYNFRNFQVYILDPRSINDNSVRVQVTMDTNYGEAKSDPIVIKRKQLQTDEPKKDLSTNKIVKEEFEAKLEGLYSAFLIKRNITDWRRNRFCFYSMILELVFDRPADNEELQEFMIQTLEGKKDAYESTQMYGLQKTFEYLTHESLNTDFGKTAAH